MDFKKKQLLNIVGNLGSGKSAIARHTAIRLKASGYNTFQITDVKDNSNHSGKPAIHAVLSVFTAYGP